MIKIDQFNSEFNSKFNSKFNSDANSNSNPVIELVNSLPNKFFKFTFLSSQQWCQKWDSHARYSGDSFIVFIKQLYLHIYFLILNKYYDNILNSKSFINTLYSPIIDVCLINKKSHYNIFKINYEKKSFLLPINISQSILKVKIIGYLHDDFHSSTRSRYLNESRTLD